MSKGILVGAVAFIAVFAGVWWFASDHGEPVTARPAAGAGNAPLAAASPSATAPAATTSRTDSTGRPAPADPRLAALMVTPDTGTIEFVKGADGRVIQEIDQDPNSLGYKKPLRQYVYAGDKVVGLTTYRYHAGQTEIIRTAVSYKPDGSIDRYEESTSYEARK
jgi:hypothetical protein